MAAIAETLTPVAHPDPAARTEKGRAARKRVPRASLAEWSPAPDRPDPADLITGQEATRVPELIPIRHQRMLVSPFTFYRGAAVIMASDLASGPRSSLDVQCCGDAHLANFGGFASPERDLVFDINDFDETHTGPFEWDVKRLATSFEIAGRARELSAREARALAVAAARSYRLAIGEFAGMTNLKVWYAKLDLAGVLRRWQNRMTPAEVARLEKRATKAESKDSLNAVERLTTRVDGELRFASTPPLVVPLRDLATGIAPEEVERWVHERFRTYRRSLQPDRRRLLERYRIVDTARKVVGVGSVGTRCWIILLLGRDDNDPLVLQVKEAGASVLEPYTGKAKMANHGQRVVEGQRFLQAASDMLLGWAKATTPDGTEIDYYVRQLWDWKLTANVDTMTPGALAIYAEACGWTLARGHARSGDAIALAAYLGTSDRFEQSIADYATRYADQNQRDYEVVRAALKG
ncbi:MAG TPA: DUF2252 domain-containing protein [Acidimicrobiales bacterium]|nr:DUF2252 domain-containing protein [Acidimicrobiales bacterium]